MDKNRAMVSFVAIRKFDRDAARNQVFRLNRHWLVNFFDLPMFGENLPLRADQAFDGKSAVIRHVAKITAEGPEKAAVGQVLMAGMVCFAAVTTAAGRD